MSTGEIIGAGLVSHVPTIMMPKELRYQLNEGKEISLVPGIQNLKTEVLDRLKPDAVIVFDSHWFTTVEFIITGHDRRQGRYTSEELPRGISQVPYNLAGDPELAELVAAEVKIAGTPCIASADSELPINYPTVNVAHYLHDADRDEAWLSVSVCQTASEKNFLNVGRGIGEAIKKSGKRVVLLASGGMSHRFWPLDELEEHEASDPIHVITPEARAADEARIDWWSRGDHAQVIDRMDEYRPHKPEGMFGHYLMMVAAIGGRDCIAKGQKFGDYENATGTGQAHVWFERPEQGWTAK